MIVGVELPGVLRLPQSRPRAAQSHTVLPDDWLAIEDKKGKHAILLPPIQILFNVLPQRNG
jgi:hypothetical protein